MGFSSTSAFREMLELSGSSSSPDREPNATFSAGADNEDDMSTSTVPKDDLMPDLIQRLEQDDIPRRSRKTRKRKVREDDGEEDRALLDEEVALYLSPEKAINDITADLLDAVLQDWKKKCEGSKFMKLAAIVVNEVFFAREEIQGQGWGLWKAHLDENYAERPVMHEGTSKNRFEKMMAKMKVRCFEALYAMPIMAKATAGEDSRLWAEHKAAHDKMKEKVNHIGHLSRLRNDAQYKAAVEAGSTHRYLVCGHEWEYVGKNTAKKSQPLLRGDRASLSINATYKKAKELHGRLEDNDLLKDNPYSTLLSHVLKEFISKEIAREGSD